MKHFWALVTLCLLSPWTIAQQQQHFNCEFDAKSHLKQLASGSRSQVTDNGQLLTLRVLFHQFREDDGTGGFTDNQINNEILLYLNQFYAGMNIQFVSCGIDNIDNSAALHANWGDPLKLSYFYSEYENNRDNALDLLISKVTNTASGGLGTAGNARATVNEINGTIPYWGVATLAHEVGHLLGLKHTHGSLSSPGAELVDRGPGGNCATAGDNLCDTQADPRFGYVNVPGYPSQYPVNPFTCEFMLGDNFAHTSNVLGVTVTHPTDFVDVSLLNPSQLAWYNAWLSSWTIENGVYVAYDPPVTNVMSYYFVSCRTEFSDDQKDLARHKTLNVPLLQSCTVQDFGIPKNVVHNSPGQQIISNKTIEFSSFSMSSGTNIIYLNCTLLFNGDVVIPAQASLGLVESDVQMNGGSFKVSQGGVLVGNKSTFRPGQNLCGEDYEWGGIETKGSPNPNTTLNVGLVESIVQNANCAVHLGNYSTNSSFDTYPSSTFLYHSVFTNNKMDVFLDGSENVVQHLGTPLPGLFYNIWHCQFIDDPTSHAQPPTKHAMKIIGVNNVHILNSKFSNRSKVQLMSKASGLIIEGDDSDPNALYSSFSGSHQVSIQQPGLQPISVSGYTFEATQSAISVSNATEFSFSENTVNYIGTSDPTEGYGLLINNTPLFTIENNEFISNRGQGNGCVINNCGVHTNHIKNNVFRAILPNPSTNAVVNNTAIRSKNVNSYSTPAKQGLKISCNHFDKNIHQIVVEGTLPGSGISQFQGTYQEPANNTFKNGNHLTNTTTTGIQYYETAGLLTGIDPAFTTNTTVFTTPNQGPCPNSNRIKVDESATTNAISQTSTLGPNPTSDAMTIYSTVDIKTVTLISKLGNTLFSHQARGTTAKINLSTLESGTYFVRIEYSNGEIETKRVVKL